MSISSIDGGGAGARTGASPKSGLKKLEVVELSALSALSLYIINPLEAENPFDLLESTKPY